MTTTLTLPGPSWTRRLSHRVARLGGSMIAASSFLVFLALVALFAHRDARLDLAEEALFLGDDAGGRATVRDLVGHRGWANLAVSAGGTRAAAGVSVGPLNPSDPQAVATGRR